MIDSRLNGGFIDIFLNGTCAFTVLTVIIIVTAFIVMEIRANVNMKLANSIIRIYMRVHPWLR